ncbi:MAG: glycerol-3-phosphate 1-O-acyltransferase PlsY [Clostridiales bacterium]|mgnify:CR=1 FL=1|jgi:glycerol-3-phosphate acyltransferase PlsY|nr:glycerol-3-phosphate 1-O-acyltransferase PlsY [Clostridiales bacterium]
MLIFSLAVTAVVSYFLGAINGAIIMSKLYYKKDIRDYGSGNAGLTNAYRVFGKKSVALVLLIDIAKAAISVLLGWLLLGRLGHPFIGKLFAGFFVILGHVFPVYYGFKGGKGVLCSGILALMLDWRIGLLCWAVFIVILLITRYVSLGAIVSALAFPISIGLFGGGWYLEVVLSSMCAAILIVKHYQNIGRLIRGKERKFTIKKE